MQTRSRGMMIAICFCCLMLLVTDVQAQSKKKKPEKKKRAPNPAFAKVTDNPDLPRVLLIGDSISIGYTVATRELLKDKANVHRILTNGGPTIRGTANIEKWLGKEKWDVIHFNWGLHDLKKIDGKHQVPIDEYEKNLEKLTLRLKKTGATLVWCNTTPVPEGCKPPRVPDDVLKYNAVAAKIMKENQVETNDLFTYANKQLSEIQRPANVHFTPEGSKVLAQQVAKEINKALKAHAAASN